jgi:hypothetical protein
MLNGLEKEVHYTRKVCRSNRPLCTFGLFPGSFFPCGSFTVDHLDEAEPAGRSRGTGHQPVLRFQNRFHLLRRPIAPANFNQRPNDDPNHVLQEPAAIDGDGDEIALLHDGQPVNLPHRGFGGTARRLEGLEILLPHQIPRSFSHGGHIQDRSRNIMSLPILQGRGIIPIQNRVPVGLASGRYLRMKIGLGLLDLFHHDIKRKQAVQGLQKLLQCHGRGRLEVSHLPFGMHPGIGPARPDHPGLFLGDFVEFALQNSLNAHLIGLELPAAVAGAFIFQQESDSPHSTVLNCIYKKRAGVAPARFTFYSTPLKNSRGLSDFIIGFHYGLP